MTDETSAVRSKLWPLRLAAAPRTRPAIISPANGRQGKQQEDPHRQRHAAGVQELEDPAPLIDRRQDERQAGQDRPAFRVGDLREPDVQHRQIGEERDRPVLSGREERGRGEAAEQSQHRDEQRLAPDRQQHRDEGDHREQAKRDERRMRFHSACAAKTSRRGSRWPPRPWRWPSLGSAARPSSRRRRATRIATRMPIARGQAAAAIRRRSSSLAGRALPRPRARRPRSARTTSRRSDPPSRTQGPEAAGGGGRGGAGAGGRGASGGDGGRPGVTDGAGPAAGGAWTGRRRRRRCGRCRRRLNRPGDRGRRRQAERSALRAGWARRAAGADGRLGPRRRLRRGPRLARPLVHARTQLVDLPFLRLDHAQKGLEPRPGPSRRHPGHDRQDKRNASRISAKNRISTIPLHHGGRRRAFQLSLGFSHLTRSRRH